MLTPLFLFSLFLIGSFLILILCWRMLLRSNLQYFASLLIFRVNDYEYNIDVVVILLFRLNRDGTVWEYVRHRSLLAVVARKIISTQISNRVVFSH